MKSRQVRGCASILAILAVAACVSTLSGQAPSSPSPPLPAPGRLIDVGGWRLHLNCAGTRRGTQPTVVLEAGAGDFSVDWSLVQPEVAQLARVCSYDRAGSGWSDLGPRPRTLHQVVYELHTLLDKAGERGPYLLVGHSYGGAVVRLYQLLYPTDVAGMVLVEAASDNPWRVTREKGRTRSSDLVTGAAIPDVKTSGPLRESDIPTRMMTMIQDQANDLSAHANDPPRDRLPADAKRMRTWSVGQVKMHVSNDNPVEPEELAQLRTERTQTAHPLGDLPLIVVSRGQQESPGPSGEAAEEEHQQEQAAFAQLSRAGALVTAAKSGHHVPIEDPESAIQAIRRMIAAATR